MRPTGRLHLGHFFGALSNWLKLQEEYECFFFVADWHALTTHYEDTSSIAENTLQVAMDWLAVGLDPQKSTLFVQSQILEHAELHVLLSMITPLSWLERVPTYKEQIENLKGRDLGTYGFLGYPLLQSADIVLYGAPNQDLLVPVGEDQAPHVELTREVVRKFNFQFGVTVDITAMAQSRARVSGDFGLSIIADGLDRAEGLTGSKAVPLQHVDIPDIERRIKRLAASSGFENLEGHFAKFVEGHAVFKKYVRFREILTEPK